MKISEETVFNALKEGSMDAVTDMLAGGLRSGYSFSEEFFRAVRDGVREAIWQLATNATQMPCADFYEMIKQGVKEGMPSCVEVTDGSGKTQ